MKRSNSEHPYTVLKQMKCPWLDSLTAEVNRCIAEYNEFIKAEAEADKCIDFARASFLYERFVDNNNYGMVYCNFEVLKYFVVYFEQKILYNMLGKWKFTEHDIEMYNYFHNTCFKTGRYKANPVLRYIKKAPEFIGDGRTADTWNIALMTKPYGLIRVNYVDFFVNQFVACNDMVRNVKSLNLFNDKIDMFKNTAEYNLYEYPDIRFDKRNIHSLEGV